MRKGKGPASSPILGQLITERFIALVGGIQEMQAVVQAGIEVEG